MKRTTLCILALCLLFGACTAAEQPESPTTTQKIEHTYPGFPDAPETFDGMTEADLQPYFELARETLKRYILAADFSGTPELPQFPMQMTPPLREYTRLRFANATRVPMDGSLISIETRMGEGWMGDAWQRKWRVIGGKLLCNPCVDVAFRYQGVDSDSGFGMGVQLLIEDPRSPTLVDWFDPDKGSWDRQVREGHYDLPDDADPWAVHQWPASWNLSDPENWLGNCKLLPPADIIFD